MLLKRNEVSQYREEELLSIKSVCPILGVRMPRTGATKPVLDHSHELPQNSDNPDQCGRIRGVISQAANTFLGRVEKYWKKYCQKHTDLSLPDVLRNMADFLDRDFSENPIHHIEIDKQKKKLQRCSVDVLIMLLEKEGILIEEKIDKTSLIMLYLSRVIIPRYQYGG